MARSLSVPDLNDDLWLRRPSPTVPSIAAPQGSGCVERALAQPSARVWWNRSVLPSEDASWLICAVPCQGLGVCRVVTRGSPSARPGEHEPSRAVIGRSLSASSPSKLRYNRPLRRGVLSIRRRGWGLPATPGFWCCSSFVGFVRLAGLLCQGWGGCTFRSSQSRRGCAVFHAVAISSAS